MTTAKDYMATDMACFFNTDEFAKTVFYTPKATGVPVETQIIFTLGVDANTSGIKGDDDVKVLTCKRDARSNFKHGQTRNVATVEIQAADIPDPKYLDTLLVDGVIWTVKEVFSE